MPECRTTKQGKWIGQDFERRRARDTLGSVNVGLDDRNGPTSSRRFMSTAAAAVSAWLVLFLHAKATKSEDTTAVKRAQSKCICLGDVGWRAFARLESIAGPIGGVQGLSPVAGDEGTPLAMYRLAPAASTFSSRNPQPPLQQRYSAQKLGFERKRRIGLEEHLTLRPDEQRPELVANASGRVGDVFVAVVEEPSVEWRYLVGDALAETGSDGEVDEYIPGTGGSHVVGVTDTEPHHHSQFTVAVPPSDSRGGLMTERKQNNYAARRCKALHLDQGDPVVAGLASGRRPATSAASAWRVVLPPQSENFKVSYPETTGCQMTASLPADQPARLVTRAWQKRRGAAAGTFNGRQSATQRAISGVQQLSILIPARAPCDFVPGGVATLTVLRALAPPSNLAQIVARSVPWKNYLVPSRSRLAMVSAWGFIIGVAGIQVATVAVAILVLVRAVRPLIVKIRRPKHSPRSGTLRILSNPDGAKFEIVAVHGLGADPEHTWTHAAPTASVGRSQEPTTTKYRPAHNPRVHLLRDLLGPDFPEARILSFEHNSNWLTDAPVKTSEEIGNSLLRELKDKRSHLPIIFIGHSLGGIIIKHALCGQEAKTVVDDTSGIIFLGTPHIGSSVSVAGGALAFVTGLLGSDTTLLLSLKSHDAQLSNLAARFRPCVSPNKRWGQKTRIISFYETKPMYLLGWLSIGRVVARGSAVVHADEEHDIDSDHSGLNKCAGRGDELYQKLKKAVYDLRVPTLLEQADKLICDKHYTEDKLKIVRLSGDQLPMDQCYINLTIVEKFGPDADHSDQQDAKLSPFTLLSRQKVELPPNTIHVELATLFSQRTGRPGGTVEPRRILIRGPAGVGKTTLCKKIVHEFTRHTWSEWTRLFDRVLWVPLRNLKLPERAKIAGYNFEHLFNHEYFSLHNKPELAPALLDALKTDSSKTLFLLDGLDELSQDLAGHGSMPNFLGELLQQRNVIITSRPNANHPALQDLDLELETIGFYPEQVEAYLEADPKMKQRANEVKSFLQQYQLIQGLVRIPIQLDALCYAWEDLKRGTLPNTMTRIYLAIEQKLWKKDAVRLNKISGGDAQIARPAEIKLRVKTEIALLECFAFNGLHSAVVDFTPDHRDKFAEMFQLSDLPLDETLARLSFLRTSDPSSRLEDRNYHFLHLTCQEYFAARYFVQRWKDRKPLAYVFNQRKGAEPNHPTHPAGFLRRFKYSPHYDVFWRFVAGLLEAEGENEILSFFNSIEDEPFDLLGPTHQRLVMHCLSEVPGLPTRPSLEARLSQWLLFERDFGGYTLLATESELPAGALQHALKQISGRERVVFLAALVNPGRHASEAAVAAVAALLKDESKDVRLDAAEVLQLSKLPEATLATLTALLKDEDKDVRSRATMALGGRSGLPEATLVTLTALLKDEDKGVRLRAAEALGRQSKLPVATLAALLKDDDNNVRSRAAEALGKQSKLPEATLLALLALLKDVNENVRSRAAMALGRQSKLLEATLVTLTALLKDDSNDVRSQAAEALGRQSKLPEATLLALGALLKDVNENVRSRAAMALGRQSKLPEATLVTLTALLKDKDNDVRSRAAEALGGQSKLPEATLSVLVMLLKDEMWTVRSRAAEALGRQSKLPEATLFALVMLLKDEKRTVRSAVDQVLRGQSDLPEKFFEAIGSLLESENRVSTSQMDCEQFLSSTTGPTKSWKQLDSTASGGMLTATRSGFVAKKYSRFTQQAHDNHEDAGARGEAMSTAQCEGLGEQYAVLTNNSMRSSSCGLASDSWTVATWDSSPTSDSGRGDSVGSDLATSTGRIMPGDTHRRRHGKDAPFSIQLLKPNRRHDDAPPSIGDYHASLMPASYRTESDNIAAVGRHVSACLERELDLRRLDSIHDWLWLAGRLAPPRPLHRQIELGREVFVTERMDMHLVWTKGKLFLKPMPRLLLEPSFWAAYLSEPQEQCRSGGQNVSGRLHQDHCDPGLRKRAMGLLFSYAALISHESDFRIATDKQLLPSGVQWSEWRKFVEQIDTEWIYPHIDRRFYHGELRLSRLNKIYFLQNPLQAYMPAWDRYSAFFHDNFAWLASAAIYIAIVLAAMQVGLATELGHSDVFQSAAYGFTFFSIVGPLAIVSLIVLFFCVAFTYNWIKAIDYRKRRTGTILQCPAGP
ncbi:hypothetical protein Purlil1_12720 [Purpureocillium lilacinum]|uniref:NACHT domain-containing protein n=1 Tax=Purpureocillium lilacinum TaxID=33203 RepID=A0ABR0BG25_PURLI|nr:hypothetical protein Purlil1_12720 [Purpureocillium lilacinum]